MASQREARKSIGIVTTWFERGAAYVSKQFEETLKNEFEVFIYARGGESYAQGDPNWDKDNVTWGKKIQTPFQGTLINKKEFIQWIKRYNIQTVIFNEQRWWLPLIWCNEIGVKTIAYIDYYTEITIPLYEAYDLLICNTKKHLKAFEWHKGAKYIPWGTDVEMFAPKTTETSKNEDVVRFFHSCGMNPKRKGTDLLLKSLRYIQQTNYKLIIHSQVSITKFFPELKDLINEYEENGKLEVIVETVSAPGLYHLGDVYVYPSRLEGIGLTIAEAVSSGLALIIPDDGPMNEFGDETFSVKTKIAKLFSRSDGYYWPQNEVSIEELGDSMNSFLVNISQLEKYKSSARNYALEYLDWDKNSTVLNEIIRELLTGNFNVINESTKNKITNYENSGSKKYNRLAMKFSFLYKAYRKFKR